MHSAVMDYVRKHRPTEVEDVLDVGGRNINGSARDIFPDAETYLSVDLHPGAGVDIVGDICEMDLEDFADVVLCLEVLEHAENWVEIVEACAAAAKPGGRVVITCAGEGRAPHSHFDGGPLQDGEYYANITAEELSEAMTAAGLIVVTDVLGEDTRAVGSKS